MIVVVIPFFQTTPGLLHRALRSVAAQAGAPPVRVLVVDDASPTPPEPELDGLPAGFRERITLLTQRNAGPGAARNRALDRLPRGADAVAFLDSDDAWRPGHLARAAAALHAGADFYFADHRREEDLETRFAQSGFTAAGSAIGRAPPNLRWCDPRQVFRSIILRSPVGTSTVVVRRTAIGPHRFPNGLRAAGEDSSFWLELLSDGLRTACSLECEVDYGRGVSVYNHRSWGDARVLRTLLDDMRAQRRFRSRFRLDAALDREVRARCESLDLSFCTALLACGRRGQASAAPVALRYLLRRPQALLRLGEALGKALRTRAAPQPA